MVFQTLQQMFQETISTIQTDHKGAELGNQKTTIIFCERSLLSSRFIFERMLVAQQSMNLLEHQIVLVLVCHLELRRLFRLPIFLINSGI